MLPQSGSGEAVIGIDAVRQVLSGFHATKGHIDRDVRKVGRSSKLALVCADIGLTWVHAYVSDDTTRKFLRLRRA
jgi:hypothetical protein